MLSPRRRLRTQKPSNPVIWTMQKPYPAEADQAQFPYDWLTVGTAFDAAIDPLASLPRVYNGMTEIPEALYDLAHPVDATGDPLHCSNGGYGGVITQRDPGNPYYPIGSRWKDNPGSDRGYVLEHVMFKHPVTGDWYSTTATDRSIAGADGSGENGLSEYTIYQRAVTRAGLYGAPVVEIREQVAGRSYSGGTMFYDAPSVHAYFILPSKQGTSSNYTVDGHFKDLQAKLLRIDNPGATESITTLGIVGDVWPLTTVHYLDNGTNIYAGGNRNARPCISIGYGNDITAMRKTVPLPCPTWWPPVAYNEITITVHGNVVRAYVRPPFSGAIYRAISRSYGEAGSWTMLEPDLGQMQNKKPGAKRLSNGVTILATTYGGLDTLQILGTRPGSDVFEYSVQLLPGDPPVLIAPFNMLTGENYGDGQTYYQGPAVDQGNGSYLRTGSKKTAKQGRGRTYVYVEEIDGEAVLSWSTNHNTSDWAAAAIDRFNLFRTPSIPPIASWAFNEASGAATLTDASGNGNHLTVINPATDERYDGPHAGEYSRLCDGSTTALWCENPAQISTISGMSAEIWVWFGTPMTGSGSPTANQHVAGVYQSGNNVWFVGTYYSGGVNKLAIFANQFSTSSTLFSVTMDPPAPYGWVCVVIDDDPTGLRVEVNNQPIDLVNPPAGVTVSGTIPKHVYYTNAAKLTLAADGPIGAPVKRLTGAIGPMKLWNRSRPRTETQAAYVAPVVPSYAGYSDQLKAALPLSPNRFAAGDATALDTFIGAVIACGAWDISTPLTDPANGTVFDALWVMRSFDKFLTTINLINPGTINLTPLNGPSYTRSRGWAGNGINADLFAVPANTAGLRFSQNCAFAMAKVNDNPAAEAGGIIGLPNFYIKPRVAGDLVQVRANDTSTQSAASADSRGLWCLNRDSSTTYKLWRDTTNVMTKTVGGTNALPSSTFLVGANSSSTISTRQIGMAAFGGLARNGNKLTDGMIAAINTAWAAYEAATA